MPWALLWAAEISSPCGCRDLCNAACAISDCQCRIYDCLGDGHSDTWYHRHQVAPLRKVPTSKAGNSCNEDLVGVASRCGDTMSVLPLSSDWPCARRCCPIDRPTARCWRC